MNWKPFNRGVISRFLTIVDRNLEGLNLCDKIGCNSDHRPQIYSAYRAIVSALKEGTAPFTFHQRKKFTPVPGWNQFCRQLHCKARAAFLRWVETGKIRFGEIFQEMKTTRRNFIDAQNYCKSNRNKINDMQIDSSFRNKNMNDFWKSARKKSKQNSGGNCVIYGFRDSKDVANLFANKFGAATSAHVRNNQTPVFRPNLYFNHRIKSNDLIEAVTESL